MLLANLVRSASLPAFHPPPTLLASVDEDLYCRLFERRFLYIGVVSGSFWDRRAAKIILNGPNGAEEAEATQLIHIKGRSHATLALSTLTWYSPQPTDVL